MTFSSAEKPLVRRALLAIISLFLIECVVSGPFLGSLGFYWDDWPVVSIYSLFGRSGLRTYFTGNRPVVGWLFSHVFPVLGVRPLGWHLAVLGLLSLTAIAIFLTFRALWPARPDIAWLLAALVLLYPGFTEQSIAVTFLPHYLSLLLFVISLRMTLYTLRGPRLFWLLTGIAILFGLASYGLTEYFIGLELFRMLVIWCKTRQYNKFLKIVAPYAVAWVGFLVWRSLLYHSAADYKDVGSGLHKIAHSPLHSFIDRVGVGIHNILVTAVFAWSRPFSAQLIEGRHKWLFAVWTLAAIVFIITAITLWFLRKDSSQESAPRGMLLAIGALLVSGLPLIVPGMRADFGTFPSYEDRLTLPFILAASLLLAVLLVRIRRFGGVIISGLLCVLAVFQMQNQMQYRQDWALQRSIFWQTVWRAPSLTSGTSVFVDGLPKSLYKNHAAGMLDLLYSAKPAPKTLSYFIFDLDQPLWSNFKKDVISTGSVRSYEFHGRTSDSLVWWISPGGVLYTVDGSADDEPRHSGLCADLASLSTPERLMHDRPSGSYALLKIYGDEPHAWLYYYQQAELERQLGMWDVVALLGDEAARNKYQPSEGAEWRPFIEGYARMGRYEIAEHLTELALADSPELQKPLSALWRKLLALQSAAAPIWVTQALEERLDLAEAR